MRGLTAAEIGRRGKELYEAGIRTRVETEHRGKYIAIDVCSGEYEIDQDSLAAAKKLRERQPEAAVLFIRIGMRPHRLGGGIRRVES